MKKKPVFIICNALSDSQRLERGIYTDSPAATRKVFSLVSALKSANRNCTVISMGRGKSSNSKRFYRSSNECIGKCQIKYMPFVSVPLLTHFVSMFALVFMIFKIEKFSIVIFYNRLPNYFFAVFFARARGIKCYLDLEDADIISTGGIKAAIKKIYILLFDRLASSGVILASSKMSNYTKINNETVFYGVADKELVYKIPSRSQIHCLFSGTISEETGANILYEAIQIIRNKKFEWADGLVIEICGSGNYLDKFSQLGQSCKNPKVVMHGRLSTVDYKELLKRCSIGFSLKPKCGHFADTTFPSKVVEYVSHGLFLIATDISDVRLLLGDGPFYINNDDAMEIVHAIEFAVENKIVLTEKARKISCVLSEKLDLEKVGLELDDYFE